jgi:hypothetical protein
MKLQKKFAFLALIALASAVAVAAESAYDFVACTHGKRTAIEENGDFAAYAIEGWGVVASTTTKDWENASTHCVGYLRVTGGKPLGRGVCKWVQATGDMAVGEFEYSAVAEPRFTWLSGTGKLKGISGGGTFKEVFNAKTVDPGTGQGCRRDWGKYILP